MNRFAALLDRLAYEPRRNAKLRLMADYFSHTPDPERGWALAALTGSLSFRHAKPGLIRGLIEARTDPVLFHLSWDYVGDLSETVALMWPAPPSPLPGGAGVGVEKSECDPNRLFPNTDTGRTLPFTSALSANDPHPAPGSQSGGLALPARGREEPGPGPGNPPPHVPTLAEVVEGLSHTNKIDLPRLLAGWLDALDETGRWALLKLITGELRIGVSARLAKTAVGEPRRRRAGCGRARLARARRRPTKTCSPGSRAAGREPRSRDPAPFRPPMLSHPLEDEDLRQARRLTPSLAEWKWDGIRLQAACGRAGDGRLVRRIYSRTGEDISRAFPDLVAALDFEGAIDGELLVVRDGRVQSLQRAAAAPQPQDRDAKAAGRLSRAPARLRHPGRGRGGPAAPALRRAARAGWSASWRGSTIRASTSRRWCPSRPGRSWRQRGPIPPRRGRARMRRPSRAAWSSASTARMCPGRPKGLWYKWKRDPYLVDAVLMYAQRGHGKRSSFYSDYTFGVWRGGPDGDELAPVGKAYFGFTDEELQQLDRYVRNHTVNRFGPVREVAHGQDRGLVLEVAFEGLQRSKRHKSGVAMRFPRINRIRWDKPTAEADRIETLEKILAKGETEQHPFKAFSGEVDAGPPLKKNAAKELREAT